MQRKHISMDNKTSLCGAKYNYSKYVLEVGDCVCVNCFGHLIGIVEDGQELIAEVLKKVEQDATIQPDNQLIRRVCQTVP